MFSNSSNNLPFFGAEVYLQLEKPVSTFNEFSCEDTRDPQIKFLEIGKGDQIGCFLFLLLLRFGCRFRLWLFLLFGIDAWKNRFTLADC